MATLIVGSTETHFWAAKIGAHEVGKVLCLGTELTRWRTFLKVYTYRTKVAGTAELDHICPIPIPDHLIINIVNGGRGELVLCPNYFVGDCRSLAGSPLFGQYGGMSLGRVWCFWLPCPEHWVYQSNHGHQLVIIRSSVSIRSFSWQDHFPYHNKYIYCHNRLYQLV